MEPDGPDRNKRDIALKDLERLQQEGDILSGLLRRTTAAETDDADPIERWGRRVGRTLALVAFLGLCVYFYLSHVR